MYYYYAMAALGVHVWWKQYLTLLQIAQFVVDIIVCTTSLLFYCYSDLGCHGSPTGGVFGLGLLASYFVLFVRFYALTYTKNGRKEADGSAHMKTS